MLRRSTWSGWRRYTARLDCGRTRGCSIARARRLGAGMSKAAIAMLTLFVEKVEYLESRSLVRTLIEGGSTLNLNWEARDESGVLSVGVAGPNAEQVEAFVLTMRLFMQDNDRISLRRM